VSHQPRIIDRSALPCSRRAPQIAKIEGQVRGPRKMTQAGTYCPDAVVQAAFVT
jgi:DNA-binding FrmR family transcriptional regulator